MIKQALESREIPKTFDSRKPSSDTIDTLGTLPILINGKFAGVNY